LYLSLRGLGFKNWRDHEISGEEYFIRSHFLGALERPCVLDIGAYDGSYAKIVRRYSPFAIIHCFEPHPRTFQVLQEAARDLGFSALPLGCGAYTGKAELFDLANSDGSKVATIYREVLENLHPGESLRAHTVDMTTVDQFAAAHHIEQIDLL